MEHPHPIEYRSPNAWADGGGRRSGPSFGRIAGQLAVAAFVIAGSVVLCAIGGGIIGKTVATLYPSYYPSVFATAAAQPGFDANAVGIGLGIGQGAAAGILVGLVLVLALAIANRRRSRPQT